MNEISALNPAADVRTPVNRFGEMESEDFIRIIFTELTNQDPFEPNDTGALLQQLNSIRSIESDMALTSKLEALVFENQLGSASNMIGKYIGGMNELNDKVSGFVISVLRQGNDIQLELDNGWVVPLDSVEMVLDPNVADEFINGQRNNPTPA